MIAHLSIRMVLMGLIAGLLSLSPGSPASASPATVTDGVGGVVYSTVTANGITYVGGSFSAAGAAAGSWASTSPSDGAINRNWPVANGNVYASVSDGSGGYYIGGDFTLVGTQARSRLAHVLADGTVDPAWAAPVGDNVVYALARAGSVLYVGGNFTQVHGTTRNRLAAVDTSTGSLLGWDPSVTTTNSAVRAVTVLDSKVYLGGNFTTIGGQTRNRAAAVSTYTDESAPGGAVQSWNPNVAGTAGTNVYAIAASASTVYLGGNFTFLQSTARNRMVAVTADTGTLTGWNRSGAGGTVQALILSGDTLYAGGAFSTFAGATRNRLAAIATDGTLRTWSPSTNGAVFSMLLDSGTLYIGGDFSTVNSIPRERAAAVTAYTSAESPGGSLTAWDPKVNARVNTIGVSGSSILTGASYSALYNFVVRNNLAALDADGRLTAWNPEADSQVRTMVLDGSTLYVAGNLSAVGGVSRAKAAAVSTYTSEATPGGSVLGWAPTIGNNMVFAMVKSGSTIYAGGSFTTAGGQTRTRLAAFSAYTDEASPGGTLLGWNPSASGGDNQVRALATDGTSIYVGGEFTTVNSTARQGVAALSPYTDEASPGAALRTWNPQISSGSVYGLMVADSTVYLGGNFAGTNNINGNVSRNRAVAVSAYSSADQPGAVASPWNPNMDSTVWAFAKVGTTIYMGGDFNTVDGVTRNRAAAVDATTAALAAWNPSLRSSVYAITANSSVVYLAGNMDAFVPVGSGIGGPALWASAGRIGKFQAATANPPQAGSATITGNTLYWVPGVNGGVTKYFVMYRVAGSGKPWGIYATGAGAVGTTYAYLNNPGTKRTCSAANTALGYSNCAMPYGWRKGTTYEITVYAQSENGKNSVGPLQALTTYRPR